MRSLILPQGVAPTNLRLRESVRARYIDSDLYDICRRLKELHPAVYVVELTEGDMIAWSVMEDCPDGVQRLIFKCGYGQKIDALDGRVITHLQKIMHVPFAHRYEAACKEIDAADAQRKDDELEKLFEDVGRPMWTQLEHDGFIQRNRSYAKRGVRAS